MTLSIPVAIENANLTPWGVALIFNFASSSETGIFTAAFVLTLVIMPIKSD